MRTYIAFAALLPAVALAQSSGGSFAISHSAIYPGAALKGDGYFLTTIVGQPATSSLGAGTFELTGGLNAAGSGNDTIFRNGFEP